MGMWEGDGEGLGSLLKIDLSVRERTSTLYMCISGNPKVYTCMWYMCVFFFWMIVLCIGRKLKLIFSKLT